MSDELIESFFGTKVPEDYSEDDAFLNPPSNNRCEPDPRGMGVVFFEKMNEYSDKIAQIDPETDTTFTHGEVLLRSIRVAQHLEEYGITDEDIVLLCCGNHMNSCIPFIASLFLRVKVSSLDPSMSASDSTYLLSLVKPKIIFCDAGSEELLEKCLLEADLSADIVVFGETDTNIPYSNFVEHTGTEDTFEPKHVNDIFDTAIIFFSSGTTGLPKGICTTHYGLLYQNTHFGLNRDNNVFLYFTTLYWISGAIVLTTTIMFGTTRIVCGKFDPRTVFQIAERYKVNQAEYEKKLPKFATLALFAPTYAYRLTEDTSTITDYNTESLECILIGGGPIGQDQLMKLRELLPYTHVFSIFGMTEAAGAATCFTPRFDKDLIEAKPGSAGLPVPGFSYRIVDPDTNEILGPNTRGELRIKGKCLMSGYHEKPDEYKKAWDLDGYMCTGDIAYYDEDYCFYIVDRIKDMLKYQSWHVAPAEIESVILTHPDVEAVVVIGIPDEVDGDLPMAVIVVGPEATVTEEEMLDYVNERVSDRKQLRGGVKFVESIPLTPSGKLRRKDVRDWILSGAE